MSAQRPVVWLLRSGDEPDPYEEALADAGFEGHSVPVLRFERLNEDRLRTALEHPKKYSGLVFTSPRAVEALVNAMSWLPSENAAWHAKAVYAVGQRTAQELRRAGFEPDGEQSGSAVLLAEYIAKREFEKPLLFLCGDRRLEDLPDMLEQAGVAVDELCVYSTLPRSDIDVSHRPDPDWIVFFSPSGLDSSIDPSGARLAAIGSTTAAALQDAGYKVDAVAHEPSPAGVVTALLSVAEGRGGHESI